MKTNKVRALKDTKAERRTGKIRGNGIIPVEMGKKETGKGKSFELDEKQYRNKSSLFFPDHWSATVSGLNTQSKRGPVAH